MLLSVIVPVYNGEPFLADAIASVRRQGYEPMEIIVVDDGSTDGTPDLAATLGSDLTFVTQENKGPASARNRALKLATGDYVAFLDADDLWPPDKLNVQMPALRENDRVQIVMGKTQRFWSNEELADSSRLARRTPPWDEPLLGCMLCRRDVFAQIGVFDETLRIGEDTDWFLRARSAGVPIAKTDAVTLYYRRHGASLTAGVNHMQSTVFDVLRLALRRHRQNPAVRDRTDANYES